MRRGDLATGTIPGGYGKPGSVLVVQDDAFDALPSVTVLPLTTDLHDLPLVRISVEPSDENGLRERSQIMVDKAATVRRERVGQRIGRVDGETMRAADIALARFLGLA